MAALVSRDPFARQSLCRVVVPAYGQSCRWCGSVRPSGSLFRYLTETDGGRTFPHVGLFCSVSCYRSYHH